MKADVIKIGKLLNEKGLKITPQRLSILSTILGQETHPSVDQILKSIRKQHPGIATGTVYKVLDTLIKHGLIKRVKTDKGIMRYDGITENHHHLYCTDSDNIKDYKNPLLDELLYNFFKKNQIENFKIEDVKLQINGKFTTSELSE
jgi:Fur family peroxide stress response transcriptional regulator